MGARTLQENGGTRGTEFRGHQAGSGWGSRVARQRREFCVLSAEFRVLCAVFWVPGSLELRVASPRLICCEGVASTLSSTEMDRRSRSMVIILARRESIRRLKFTPVPIPGRRSAFRRLPATAG